MAASSTTLGSRAVDLTAGFATALASGAATWWVADLPASFAAVVAALYATLAAIVWLRLPEDSVGPGLGAANRVTLARAALAVPVLALPLYPDALDSAGLWWVIVLSTVVLLLDGVDGRIARRSGTESRFGARFDMEVDAALILALSVLVWMTGKVGAWVLLIGGMRYLFVAGSRIWPALQSELPPSKRRQGVCVVQGVVLLVAMGPIIPTSMAVAMAAGGLAALVYSFGVDIRWALMTAERQDRAGRSVADPASNTSSR